MKGQIKHPALAVCCIQLALLAPATLVLLALSPVAAYSGLLGGMLFILPNAYFTHYAFRFRGAERASDIVRSFYWGEAGKLALVVVGFAAVFRFVNPLHVPALVGAYIGLVVLQWLIAPYVARRIGPIVQVERSER